MRILITNTGPWGTGSFTVADAVLKELRRMGHESILFFPDASTPSEEQDEYYKKNDLYKILKFPRWINGEYFKSFPLMIPDPHPRSTERITYKDLTYTQLHSLLEDLKKELTAIVKDFSPDIVECQHIWALDHLIWKMGCPFVCTAHHSDQLGYKFDERMRPLALESAKKSSYIFAISEFVKNEVMSIYSVCESKVPVLTNGYDKSVFQVMHLEVNEILTLFKLSIPDNAILVSFAGKISKTKGIDTLLQANKHLQGSNIHFLIMGTGDIKNELSKTELEQCELNRCHFLGHLTTREVAMLHNICKFNVLPSRSEGFGIACLEAMGCGLPVIGTNSGGLKEFIVGRSIPAERPKLLAKVIKEMANLDEKNYKILSQKALETAHKYSWQCITKQRLNYYEKTLENFSKIPK